MPRFRSSDELFQAVRDLAARLETNGHRAAAERLRGGFAYLNGLTDGWAGPLQAVEEILATRPATLGPGDRDALEAIRSAAHAAVYRR